MCVCVCVLLWACVCFEGNFRWSFCFLFGVCRASEAWLQFWVDFGFFYSMYVFVKLFVFRVVNVCLLFLKMGIYEMKYFAK